MQYVYQPFTTTDLLNWQQHTPAYSEEPQAVTELLTNIVHSHQPNWDDCRQLMSTPFTSDEHWRVHQAARAWISKLHHRLQIWSDGQMRESQTQDQTGIKILLWGSNPFSI
jgi:hypothetical protein